MSDSQQPTQQGLSRRSVLRVGANAAWAVPAVSVATAAPAFAMSAPVKPFIQTSSFSVVAFAGRAGLGGYNVSVFVKQSEATDEVVNNVQLQLSITRGNNRLGQAPSLDQGTLPSGWSGTGPTNPGADVWHYVLTYGAPLTAAGSTLAFIMRRTVTADPSNPPTTWTLSVVGPAGVAASPPRERFNIG